MTHIFISLGYRKHLHTSTNFIVKRLTRKHEIHSYLLFGSCNVVIVILIYFDSHECNCKTVNKKAIKWPNHVLLASKFPLVIIILLMTRILHLSFAASLMAKIDLAPPLPPFDPFSNPSQQWRI